MRRARARAVGEPFWFLGDLGGDFVRGREVARSVGVVEAIEQRVAASRRDGGVVGRGLGRRREAVAGLTVVTFVERAERDLERLVERLCDAGEEPYLDWLSAAL
jgi:hypothetical protein